MDILGRKYSDKIQKVYDLLVSKVPLPVEYEHIRNHPDESKRNIIGQYQLESNRHLIYLDIERAYDVDVAHEFMHGVLRGEGYPQTSTVAYPRDTDAGQISGTIGDRVLHLVIQKRLKDIGFDTTPADDRNAAAVIAELNNYPFFEGENRIRQFHAKAVYALEFHYRYLSHKKRIFRLLKEKDPEAFVLGQKIIKLSKVTQFRTPRQCRNLIIAIIKILDDSLNKHDLELKLLSRIIVHPLYIREKYLSKPTAELFAIHANEFSSNQGDFIFYTIEHLIDNSRIHATMPVPMVRNQEMMRCFYEELTTLTPSEFMRRHIIPYVID